MSRQRTRKDAGMVRIVTLACAALLLGANVGSGVTTGVEAENWDLSDVIGSVSYVDGDGVVTIVFDARSRRDFRGLGTLVVNTVDPDQVFTGSYEGIGEIAVTLASADASVPGTVAVVLQANGTDRRWENVVDVSGIVDGPVAITVAVPDELGGGWDTGWTANDGAKPGLWAQDIQDIGTVGVTVEQAGTAAQSFDVSGFMLDGVPADLVPQRVLDYFTALLGRTINSLSDLTAGELAIDSDGDGMSDLAEVLAGTDPNNPNDIFAAKLVGVDPVQIEWPHAEDVSWAVLRCEKLGDGFAVYDASVNVGDADVSVTGEGDDQAVVYTDGDTAEGKSYFYKVVVK